MICGKNIVRITKIELERSSHVHQSSKRPNFGVVGGFYMRQFIAFREARTILCEKLFNFVIGQCSDVTYHIFSYK